jgi:hypothetical protein
MIYSRVVVSNNIDRHDNILYIYPLATLRKNFETTIETMTEANYTDYYNS